MKVMISQPMNGLTRKQIDENRAQAVARLEADGHTIVDSFVTDETPTGNAGLYFLGKSFEIMSAVDGVYFLDGWQEARGCKMEYEACKAYGINILRTW